MRRRKILWPMPPPIREPEPWFMEAASPSRTIGSAIAVEVVVAGGANATTSIDATLRFDEVGD